METKTKSITTAERLADKLAQAIDGLGLSTSQKIMVGIKFGQRASSGKVAKVIPVEEGTKGNRHIGHLPFNAEVSVTESDKEGCDFKLQSAQSNGVKHINKNVVLESVAMMLEGNFTSDKTTGAIFCYVPTATSKGKGVYCPAGYAVFAQKELGLSDEIINSIKALYNVELLNA